MTRAGIIYSFLFCVKFLDMVTFPNKRFILSEYWAILCNCLILCVCVCVVCEECTLDSVYDMVRAVFCLYESELHIWLHAVNVGHGHATLIWKFSIGFDSVWYILECTRVCVYMCVCVCVCVCVEQLHSLCTPTFLCFSVFMAKHILHFVLRLG